MLQHLLPSHEHFRVERTTGERHALSQSAPPQADPLHRAVSDAGAQIVLAAAALPAHGGGPWDQRAVAEHLERAIARATVALDLVRTPQRGLRLVPAGAAGPDAPATAGR